MVGESDDPDFWTIFFKDLKKLDRPCSCRGFLFSCGCCDKSNNTFGSEVTSSVLVGSTTGAGRLIFFKLSCFSINFLETGGLGGGLLGCEDVPTVFLSTLTSSAPSGESLASVILAFSAE